MGRAPCCEKIGLKKGPWTPEEDQKLIDYIQKNGYGNWRTLPKNAGLDRCGKSCRLRWTNYLRPDIKRGRFTFEEEETIIQLHSVLGNKWSAIAARLPGRTDNEIKNYWNTHIRKRLHRMGFDPVTHSPRLVLLDIFSIFGSSLFNNSSQYRIMNNSISRLLGGGVQQLVNPQELLRLATSIFSSQCENPNNFLLQNVPENHFCLPQVVDDQHQLPPLVQTSQDQTPIQELPSCVPFSSEARLMDPNIEPYSSNDVKPQSYGQLNDQWQSNGMPSNSDNYHVTLENHGSCYASEQTIMDPLPSENSNFHSNNTSNFSLASGLSKFSTPSSSPTPLHSNTTTYITGSSTEDEKDISYCSNMLKYEIPDILDVFM